MLLPPTTYAGITNQDVINAFFAVDRALLPRAFQDWAAELVGPNNSRRRQMYTGPRLEDALHADAAPVVAALRPPALLGRGLWLKTLDETGHAGGSADLDAIVADALAARLGWLSIKLGHETDAWNDAEAMRDLGDRLRAAGRGQGQFWGYHFVTGHRPDTGGQAVERQAAQAAQWVRAAGVQGLAVWVSDGDDGGWNAAAEPSAAVRRDRAARYLAALRGALGPQFPLALCAPAVPERHPDIPWDVFANGVDYLMPRCYGEDGPDEASALRAAWTALAAKPLLPVLRAFDGGYGQADLLRLMLAVEEWAGDNYSFFRWGAALEAGLWPALLDRPTGFVYREGGRLWLDARAFQFVGVNVRELLHYANPLADWLKFVPEERIADQLDAARRAGARVVRVFLPHTAYNQARDDAVAEARQYLAAHGVPQGDQPDDAGELVMAELETRLARVLDQAYGAPDAPRPDPLRLLVVLTDYNQSAGFYLDADADFYDGGVLRRPEWYGGAWQGAYWRLAQRVIRRFRDDPRIFAWEVGNELKLEAAPPTFIAFMAEVTRRIKALDRFHLVGPGIISLAHCGFSPDQMAAFYANPNLDFGTLHLAGDDFPATIAMPADIGSDASLDGVEKWRRAYIRHDVAVARDGRKPLIVEEAGYQRDRDTQLVSLLRFAAGEGATGFMPWGFSGIGLRLADEWGLSDFPDDQRVAFQNATGVFRTFWV